MSWRLSSKPIRLPVFSSFSSRISSKKCGGSLVNKSLRQRPWSATRNPQPDPGLVLLEFAIDDRLDPGEGESCRTHGFLCTYSTHEAPRCHDWTDVTTSLPDRACGDDCSRLDHCAASHSGTGPDNDVVTELRAAFHEGAVLEDDSRSEGRSVQRHFTSDPQGDRRATLEAPWPAMNLRWCRMKTTPSRLTTPSRVRPDLEKYDETRRCTQNDRLTCASHC